MGELRKDYVLERWVIIATERAKRPHQFKKERKEQKVDICYFCPGNENLTPPEIYRTGGENWQIRVFPNKFAAVKPEGNFNIKTDNDFFTFSNNYGYHEVLVETPQHEKQLSDLSIEEIKEVFRVYGLRIDELSSREGVRYVQVFKNHGLDAGTSLVHSHSQIIAYNKVPEIVEQEIMAVEEHDSCPYCRIIEIEKNSYRRCFENNSFVAFTPYASRFPFEIWVFPKKHSPLLTKDENELRQLAEIMKKILEKLASLNAPYNYVLHYNNNEKFHFHIEILPRLSTWAGFEFNGTIINAESPEEAAKFYRDEIKI